MRNYKLTINYDGTKYNGWQRQSTTEMTIQGKLEYAISESIGYAVEIDGAGRTDAGVHALGQVANVKTAGKIEVLELQQKINRQLPEDIKVIGVELVKNGFHSRLNAKAKRYVYTIDTRDKPKVFGRKYTYHYTKPLDLQAMNEAVKYVKGTKDYASFCDKKEHKSTVRSIYNIIVNQEDEQIKIAYYGSGFLYHMVRILTGTLIEIGNHDRIPADLQNIIVSRDRAQAGYLVPAQGLCLEEVYY